MVRTHAKTEVQVQKFRQMVAIPSLLLGGRFDKTRVLRWTMRMEFCCPQKKVFSGDPPENTGIARPNGGGLSRPDVFFEIIDGQEKLKEFL